MWKVGIEKARKMGRRKEERLSIVQSSTSSAPKRASLSRLHSGSCTPFVLLIHCELLERRNIHIKDYFRVPFWCIDYQKNAGSQSIDGLQSPGTLQECSSHGVSDQVRKEPFPLMFKW